VALVDAGNSAGQAAVYLADKVARVRMIVRAPSLGASMSRYPVDRIAAPPNIEVLYNVSVSALDGSDGMLQAIRCRSHLSGDERACGVRHLFLFIGADPNTNWLALASHSTPRASFVPAATVEARSKPICPAFSQSGTCAAAQSRGSPPRSVTAHRSSQHCTRFWLRPTAGPCRPGSKDTDGRWMLS
jgi:alkyl hydroperoxide reductase subunit AhpF